MTKPYMLCADIHAHSWSAFSTTNADGVNSRLQNVLDEMRRIEEVAVANDISAAIIAGDLFHTRGSVKPSVLNPIAKFLAGSKIDWVLMAGNHDLEGDNCEWLGAAISALGGKNVIIVLEPTVNEDLGVVMIPWIADKQELAMAIDATQDVCARGPDNYDLILHTGIDGVLDGMPSGHGWRPRELADFGFKRVFSGHYHNFRVLGTDDNVISIGALTHQTWSDVDTVAGFLEVRSGSWWHHASRAPQFMDLGDASDLSIYAGNFVRVRGLSLEESEIKDLRSALVEAGALGVSIEIAPKTAVVTRSGAAPSKAVKLEESVSVYVRDAVFSDPDAVEKGALSVLAKAKSALT